MTRSSTAQTIAETAHLNLHGKIAFIRAGWHKEIVDQARVGFLMELETQQISQQNVAIFDVPGAYEIPLAAKKLAQTGSYDVIAAAALVVDGGIYAHQFVAQSVISGMMQVQLEVGVPILSIVLTPQDFDDSEARRDFFFDHFILKGKEAAKACIMVLAQEFAAVP